jgi:type I restriction enzyme S subunit
MSFPRYPAYKDSGVEWLGEVPAHWDVKRLKQVFRERNERSEDGQETLLSVSAYTGVTPRSELIAEGDHLSRADSLEGYKVCHPSDLVVNIMLAWNRGLGISNHHGIVSPAYCVYSIIDGSDPEFLDFLMRSDRQVLHFKAYSSGVIDSRLRIYPETFGSLHCCLPPPSEQSSIAAFLDRETAKIDALVAEQEKLIALLQEKRQAMISHAVTKGLDPDVPMKDSGVEWLGEVPEHWAVTRLKYAAELIVDCPHETPVYADDGPYFVIRTADIEEGVLDDSAMYRVSEAEYLNRVRRQRLDSDDIVYGREGERWGHAALVPEAERFCLGQRMMQFRASKHFSPGYLMWHLNAEQTYRQGQVDTVGATSPHVNVGTIRNYVLAAPPIEEQRLIARHLDEVSARFDLMMGEAKKVVSCLAERRAALISAAVTGRIDVREFAVTA